MAPKPKRSDAGNSDVPKNRRKVLPSREKMKVLNLIRTEKQSYTEVAKIYGKSKSSVCEIVNRKRNLLSFCCPVSNCKIMTTVHGKHLLKTGKALNLYNKVF